MQKKDQWVQGFQAGYSLKQQQLAHSLTVAGTVAPPLSTQHQQRTFVVSQPQTCATVPQQTQQVAACGHVTQWYSHLSTLWPTSTAECDSAAGCATGDKPATTGRESCPGRHANSNADRR